MFVWEEDKLGAVLFGVLHVGVQGLSELVPPTQVTQDGHGPHQLLVDASHPQLLQAEAAPRACTLVW